MNDETTRLRQKKNILAIIDARSDNAFCTIYSISLFERILRQLFVAGVQHAVVWTMPNVDAKSHLRREFNAHFSISVRIEAVETEHEARWFDSLQFSSDFIFLDGDCLYDIRVIQNLVDSDKSVALLDDTKVTAAIRLSNSELRSQSGALNKRIESLRQSGILLLKSVEDIDPYVRFLRRQVPVTIQRIESGTNLKVVEDRMYDATFKGTMEWIAVYGYKTPVRVMTKTVARTFLTPNHITTLALACSFSGIPALAFGWVGTGLFLAASFLILDSLDGKLARMTLRFSKAGDRWDHLTSSPTRMGWYFTLGYYLSGYNLSSVLGLAAMLYASMPVVDKLTGVLFNAKFGRSPLDYTPLDKKVHLFTVRRNDIFLMLVSLPFGFLPEVYLFCTAWAVATWLWHAFRLIWFSLRPLSNTSPAV